jgi:hypothetical protein
MIGEVAKIVVAVQEELSVSAQIIARAHRKARRQKSRPAQPSAIAFACSSSTFSYED